jgi:outer membrane receptor protein involved in Fe transport
MKMGKRDKGRVSWRAMMTVALGVAGVVTAAPAYAQDEEIIVTATRRDTALQDVPIAVTPVTAEMLQNSGVRDIQDLTQVAPSLQFNVSENETSATARLRGIGTQGSNPGLESSVGIFVDGVYRARNGVALTDLGEVSQIEVLRGPQGTLFGRNTSAGLISVATAGPDLMDFEASADLTYGEFSERRASGHITGPIVEGRLGYRLFAAISQRDGLIDVVDFNGNVDDTNTRDLWTVRGQLLYAPSPNVEVRLIADYTRRDEECCAAQPYDPERLNGAVITFPVSNPGAPPDDLLPSPAPGAAGAVALQGGYGAGIGNQAANIAALGNGDLSLRRGFANRDYGQVIDDWGLSGEVQWDWGWAELTSVTAYRDWSYDAGGDIDFTAADLWYRTSDGSAGFGFEIFTQELRLAGESGPVDWLVGVFYSDETLERRERITLGTQFNDFWRTNSAALFAPFDPTPGATDAIDTALDGAFGTDRYEQNGESIALFTHEIVSVTDRTNVSIGLRFTHEEKDLSADFSTTFNGPGFVGGRQFLYANRGVIAGGAFNGLLSSVGEAGVCADFTAVAGTAALGSAQQVYCQGALNTALDNGIFLQSREEEEFSGVLAIQHDFNDNVSGYASVSRGYKAGGFNLDRNYDGYVQTGPSTFTITYNTGFDPEFVNAYEVGFKTTSFGNDLIANLAFFYNDYENYQLNTFNGVSFQLATIPEVISRGAELDLIWRTPIEGLSLQGGVAYVRARYGEDNGWVADSYNPYNRTFVLGRLPNNTLTNAPEWTATGSATYERQFGTMRGLGYIDFRWVDDQITGSDLNPAKEQPSYWLVNARFGLSSADERWSIEIWGRNLLDQDYQQIAFDVPLQSGNANPQWRNYAAFLGDPRTAGVTLRLNY